MSTIRGVVMILERLLTRANSELKRFRLPGGKRPSPVKHVNVMQFGHSPEHSGVERFSPSVARACVSTCQHCEAVPVVIHG